MKFLNNITTHFRLGRAKVQSSQSSDNDAASFTTASVPVGPIPIAFIVPHLTRLRPSPYGRTSYAAVIPGDGVVSNQKNLSKNHIQQQSKALSIPKKRKNSHTNLTQLPFLISHFI